jgi:hypothetical protein
VVGENLLIQRGVSLAIIKIGSQCEPYIVAVFENIFCLWKGSREFYMITVPLLAVHGSLHAVQLAICCSTIPL